jgi:hypothetical protein
MTPTLSLLIDPSLRFARDLPLAGAVLCFVAAAVCAALGARDSRYIAAGVVAGVATVILLFLHHIFARQTERAEACACDAVPQIATVVHATAVRHGLRRVTLRADGADHASDFTWILPASWGDVVRLDRAGRRVAVLSPAAAPERCVPRLRSGRPFVVPDYVTSALIAILAEDIPAAARHPDVADLAHAPAGTVPAPPALPVTLSPAPGGRLWWWTLIAGALALTGGGLWLAFRGSSTLLVVMLLIVAAITAAVADARHAKAVSVTVRSDGIDVNAPARPSRGARPLRWDEIGSVTIRWISRSERERGEFGTLTGLLIGGAVGVATGIHVHTPVHHEVFEVGDLAARLLRGDIIPELDTLEVSLRTRSGRRIATYETRTAFQPVRALLAACVERGIRVKSVQAMPHDWA